MNVIVACILIGDVPASIFADVKPERAPDVPSCAFPIEPVCIAKKTLVGVSELCKVAVVIRHVFCGKAVFELRVETINSDKPLEASGNERNVFDVFNLQGVLSWLQFTIRGAFLLCARMIFLSAPSQSSIIELHGCHPV